MKNLINHGKQSVKRFINNTRGDLSTNTIGAIIVGVVIIGLLITAVNAFFPAFFTSMLTEMETKLNGNW